MKLVSALIIAAAMALASPPVYADEKQDDLVEQAKRIMSDVESSARKAADAQRDAILDLARRTAPDAPGNNTGGVIILRGGSHDQRD